MPLLMARLRDWFLVLSAQFSSLEQRVGSSTLEVGVVVRACRDLAVVGRIRCDVNPVAGVLKDGAGGVAGIDAFEGDLEAYV